MVTENDPLGTSRLRLLARRLVRQPLQLSRAQLTDVMGVGVSRILEAERQGLARTPRSIVRNEARLHRGLIYYSRDAVVAWWSVAMTVPLAEVAAAVEQALQQERGFADNEVQR